MDYDQRRALERLAECEREAGDASLIADAFRAQADEYDRYALRWEMQARAIREVLAKDGVQVPA